MAIFGKPPDTKPASGTPLNSSPSQPASPAPGGGMANTGAAMRRMTDQHAVCVIGPQITIKGEITGDEDILVEGTVEGHVRLTRELRVGEKGVVKATVEANTITINGEVVGNCQATSRIEIQSTGRLTGDIRAPNIVIAEGAQFRGNSDMTAGRGPVKEAPKETKPATT